MKIVITGAAGFIGTNLIKYLQTDNVVGIAALDKLGFGSGGKPSVPFLYTNLQNLSDFPGVFDDVDFVVNLAAETHVDRSLSNYWKFFDSNVRGTASLLEAIGDKPVKLVHISTDEIYGPGSQDHPFTEDSVPNPHNPYAGTKAAAEMLVKAWAHQTKHTTIIARLSNIFGPYQYPEKFIPKTTISLLKGQPIPIYGTGDQKREWTFVSDACYAIEKCMQYAEEGPQGKFDSFNFSSGCEMKNIDVVDTIARCLKIKPELNYVVNRPGHDNGYSMSRQKAFEVLKWEPGFHLKYCIEETARWFSEHEDWWTAILTKNPKLLSSQPWTEKWN